MPVVITSCTARKRATGSTLELSPNVVGATLRETVENWRAAVACAASDRSAGDLYIGRSISEVRRVVDRTEAQLLFVSAGMGLIAAGDKISAYNLTPAQRSGGLASALTKHGASPADWWSCLSSNGLSRLIRSSTNTQFLIALPGSYVKMLALDLAEVSAADVARVRIFTSAAGADEVPEPLRAAVMPYDDRLESVEAYAGTRADFPQRAMRHFVEVVQGVDSELESARALVLRSLKAYEVRKLPERKRLNDSHVKALIIERWDSCQGRSSQLLRALRDEELVSCEQGRFAGLWQEVSSEMARSAPMGTLG